MDDYDVYIDDLFVENKPLTKNEIMKIFNKNLRLKRNRANTLKGIEIDVLPEWTDLLQKDGSILRAYEKCGWKVMWYNTHSLGPAKGDLVRSWLSFRNLEYKGDK